MAVKKHNHPNFHKSESIATPSASSGLKAMELFAQMMVDRMELLKSQPWEKGWINASGYSGLPRNIDGRNYAASNSFFLQLISSMKGYQLPVFLTFNQAKKMGLTINKGSKSFPVVYWDIMVKDADGKKIDFDQYKAMEKSERKQYLSIPFIKSYPVFNLDQTNFAELKPEKMEALKKAFNVQEIKDSQGMYCHSSLDRMIETQSWLCPIRADKRSNDAYYSPSRDIVVLPMKEQFKKGDTPEEIYKDGMEFYSTMLHEMTHSTMTPERLNREHGTKFGDEKYAKEELVAELTAAMICHSMGFSADITDNSAKYLDNWIGALKEEPKFILSVMSDVNKASEMILDKVDEQKIALGETPYLTKNLVAVDEFATIDEELIPFKEPANQVQLASEPESRNYGDSLYSKETSEVKVEKTTDLHSKEINVTDIMGNDREKIRQTQKEEKTVGLLEQYKEMKKKHPDAILLFRVGDFYETFKEDAVKSSEILGITMTRRADGKEGSVELAGFPHHALDTYLPKLVRAGARVAICEQLEKPQKKLAKRGISEENRKAHDEITKSSRKEEKKHTSDKEKTENDLKSSLNNENNMAKKKKNANTEPEQSDGQAAASAQMQEQEQSHKEKKEKKDEKETSGEMKSENISHNGSEISEEKSEKKKREPQMITVNGDKISHGHIFKIKDQDAPWFFVAHINGDKLKPVPISAEDANNFLEKKTAVEDMMLKYYPTKVMAKVPDMAFRFPNGLAGPEGQMSVEKFNVYKEKDETRQDFGKYKFYAVVDGQKMSAIATKDQLNEYFDRVQTPGQMVEKVFGERLHLKGHYEQFKLPEGMNSKAIHIEKNQQTNRFEIFLDYGKGKKSQAKELSYDDTTSLLKTKTATKAQLAAKYITPDINNYISTVQTQKQEKSVGVKM